MIEQDIDFLRGFFPRDMYIGGSWALHQSFPQIGYSDIDIFILGPRRFETWALEKILSLHFTDVEAYHTISYYKIPNQYKRVTCYSPVTFEKFDLIFVDDTIDTLVKDAAGSTLAQIYYEVDYSISGQSLCRQSKKALEKLWAGSVDVYPTRCTSDYKQKIYNRIKELNLKIVLDI